MAEREQNMRHSWWTRFILVVITLLLVGLTTASAAQPDTQALVKIPWPQKSDLGIIESVGVPVYAWLTTDKESYLLGGATPAEIVTLQSHGLDIAVLDPDLRGAHYYLAHRRPARPRPDWTAYGQVLLDDGAQVLLRIAPQDATRLAELGVEIAALDLAPIHLTPRPESGIPDVIQPDPMISSMIGQVDQGTLYQYEEWLTGVEAANIGGQPYTILTRNTNSGTPIQKATQFAYEHLQALGLQVEYDQWSGATYPNVIATKPGLTDPDNIYVICAHLDDMPSGATAPGADDNASGSAGVLMAADILSQYDFGCTLKFALWTGEEQGLLGSDAWATWASDQGLNIQGVLNMDMIAYNSDAYPILDLHARSWLSDSVAIANLFSDVVDAYNLSLTPDILIDVSLGNYSDNKSFWDEGYAAILAIEDDDDFTPYYHTINDRLSTLNMPYFTEFVKASLGTFVHMSGCLLPGELGFLEGHVTAASDGAPIADASITMHDPGGHSFQTTTSSSGYYTQTLVADTYTVTAEAYAYLPAVVTDVVLITGSVTTLDLALNAAPTFVVSGTVTDASTGLPLLAQIEFMGAPVTVGTDPDTGFYQANVAEGGYTMRVTAARHQTEEQPVVVDHAQTQDFALQPLPCILLVDDDNNAPDVRPYYTGALDNLGYDYNIFDAGDGNGPSLSELEGHPIVVWFSGDKFGGSAGPNNTDASNLATFLDGGGRLFLSSQDYLYDMGLTTFAQNYLGVGSFSNDTGGATTQYGVAGDPIGSGLGPYSLSYPAGFNDYGDVVNPGTGASVAFRTSATGGSNLDVDQEGESWKTVFFGTSWVPIYNQSASNGVEVLQRIVDWFGGCECQAVNQVEFDWAPPAPIVDGLVSLTATAEGQVPILFAWNLGDGALDSGAIVTHSYSSEGTYTVTLTATNICGSEVVSHPLTVLSTPCEAVQILTVTAQISGCVATLDALLSGTQPFTYSWALDAFGSSSTPTMTIDFFSSGTYPYTLTVANCGGYDSDSITGTVAVACQAPTWYFYLPLIVRQE
jgi:hypothetical protein